MQPRTLIILVLALLFGGATTIGVRALIKSQNSGDSAANSVPVVTMASDIPRGERITAEHLESRRFPKDMVPEGALTDPTLAVDRTVAIPMLKGEPILDGKLSSKSAGRGLASLIPSGMRAMTIQTTNVATGVAGLIMPGNKVDVMLTVMDTGSVSEATGGGSATTLLQRVEILAVDQQVDGATEKKLDPKEMRSVTLLVTPQQANLLDLAQTKGILHLSLRNPNDNVEGQSRPVTVSELRFHQDKPWDEKLKGVIDSLAKARLMVPPPPVASLKKEPSLAPSIRIRTIRGTSEGSVYVHAIDSLRVDRLAHEPR